MSKLAAQPNNLQILFQFLNSLPFFNQALKSQFDTSFYYQLFCFANDLKAIFRNHLSHLYLVLKTINKTNFELIDESDFCFSFQKPR
jgi:hypothetical protein